VEDNAEVRAFALDLLQELGFKAEVAESGQAALELLSGGATFDVIFSDVVMPGMSGIEFAKIIRNRSPELPIVLTSGYSHVLVEEGQHGFPLLHKPYSAEAVSRALYEARSSVGVHFGLSPFRERPFVSGPTKTWGRHVCYAD
jgi:CheY-like chemotaxis protein